MSDQFESLLVGLKKLIIDEQKALKNQKQTFQYPPKIALRIGNRPLHPDHPTDNDWAIIYRHSFKTAGYAGLAKAVQHRAKDLTQDLEISNHGNYYPLTQAENLVPFMMILASMYPSFIESLISGTTYHLCSTDKQFKQAIDLSHYLEKTPGNYLQGLVHNKTVLNPNATTLSQSTQAAQRIDNVHAGRGLTFNQLHHLFDLANKYMPGTSRMDLDLVKKIDTIWAPTDAEKSKIDYTRGQHKYVKLGSNDEKFKRWLKTLKRSYIDRIETIKRANPADPCLDIPMSVSLLEVGWGVDQLARSASHSTHTQSNSLFTFFQALVKHLGDDYSDIPSHNVIRLSTNKLFRPDLQDAFLDAKLADVGITMLAQSEWYNGGLNPVPGGGAGVQSQPLVRAKSVMELQRDKLYTRPSSRFKMNIQQDVKKMRDLIEFAQTRNRDIDMMEQNNWKLKDMVDEKWKKIQDKVERLEKINVLYISRKATERAGVRGVSPILQGTRGSQVAMLD